MNHTLHTFLRSAACAAVAVAASAASAACYSVYDSKGKLLQQTAQPPVDMRYHLGHTVPKKYGVGASMAFEAPVASACLEYSAIKNKGTQKTLTDNEAILDNLAREYQQRAGVVQGHADK